MKCPNPMCKAELKPGAKFCQLCGRRIENETAQEHVFPEVDATERAIPELVVPKPVPPVVDGRGSVHPKPPFTLAVAMPKAMQVGRRSNVELKFCAASDIYESVEFILRCGADEIGRAKCCNGGRPGTFAHTVILPVTPKTPGDARLELCVSCCVKAREMGSEGGKPVEILPAYFETHVAELRVMVDDRAASSFNPVFNISQNQTSDRAGDTSGNINLNFGGLQIAPQTDPERYKVPSGEFVPLDARLAASPVRLTLKCGDEVVQLLSDESISFGRKRTTAVPIRICGSDGHVDKALNENTLHECYISRYHFTLERTGSECTVRDGACGSHSSTGTRVDGIPIASGGAVRLKPGRDISIEAGCEGHALGMRIMFHCDSLGRAAGFVLTRLDGARQKVCAVWREVPFGDYCRISWNGSCWAAVLAGDGVVPLAVGSKVSIGGRQYDVLAFHQTHVK